MLRRRRAMRTLIPRIEPVAPVMATTIRLRRPLVGTGGIAVDVCSSGADCVVDCVSDALSGL